MDECVHVCTHGWSHLLQRSDSVSMCVKEGSVRAEERGQNEGIG